MQHTQKPPAVEAGRGDMPFQDIDAEIDAAMRRTAGTRAAIAFERKSNRGGIKSTRRGGRVRPLPCLNAKKDKLANSRGRLSMPADLYAGTYGYRFSQVPATNAQHKALTKIIVTHVRRTTLAKYRGLSPETMAEATGLSAPTVRKLLETRLIHDDDAGDADLASEVLSGMFLGTLAGPLGTRKTVDTEWLFRRIDSVNYRRFEWAPIGEGAPFDMPHLFAAFKLDCLALNWADLAKRA